MVGGAHGQTGHHVMLHVVVVRGPDNVIVTIRPPQGLEDTALVAAASNRFVTLQAVQVRPLRISQRISNVLANCYAMVQTSHTLNGTHVLHSHV